MKTHDDEHIDFWRVLGYIRCTDCGFWHAPWPCQRKRLEELEL